MAKHQAYLDGWLAHKNEHSQKTQPYNEATQAFSATQWVSGWCDRFSAIKHGLELTHDDAQFASE